MRPKTSGCSDREVVCEREGALRAYSSKRLLSGICLFVPFEGAHWRARVATLRADERPFSNMLLAGTETAEEKLHCLQLKGFSPE